MKLEHLALAKTDDLPIRHEGNVHSGKVRSVYWLNMEDSERIIQKNNYTIYPQSQLGVMVISDRISAFNANWQGENGLGGVPRKGASLNMIAKYWFDFFSQTGFANNHLIESPHPLLWIVQKAEPIMVEAIVREYITGSLWREYEKGKRDVCGITLPNNLSKNKRLDGVIFTPTTKGTLHGIKGIPEEEDVSISLSQITENYNKFGFKARKDVEKMRDLSIEGFKIISSKLDEKDLIFVDTKYEFGYLQNKQGGYILGFIDEIGNPDSSRMWVKSSYKLGLVVEKSKEDFRQFLLEALPQYKSVLVKGDKKEVGEIAGQYNVPVEEMMTISIMYKEMAEQITGKKMPKIENPKEEITEALMKYNIIE